MAYQHGITVSEMPTAVIPAVNSMAGLPVVFGTAPVHLATDRAATNRPVLCYSYSEAVAALGYSDNWKDYTLCEVMYSQFALYGIAPVVFVNVLDPKVHKIAVDNQEVALVDKAATIVDPVLMETLKIKKTSAGQVLILGEDYEAAYDKDGNVVITIFEGGALSSATSIIASYDKVDPSAVSPADIIGGVDVNTGALKGLEALNQVFAMYRLVPGMVAAPGWGDDPEVAAVMAAKASVINGLFKCTVLLDVPTETVKKYTDVPGWKTDNSCTGVDQYVGWPMAKIGEKIFHMSTHAMGCIGKTDFGNDDIPYESPSNKKIQINGLCLADGTEVILNNEQANYLNGQGIFTALNFIGGWVLWGNRTACYPGNTDPKDSFLCVRRMFNWHAQTFIQTYWVKVDKPMNKRLIETVVDSENIRLNGLTARQYLLGGRVEFLQAENPTTDLIDGIIRFHTYLTPPVPAREISNILEFDVSYFDTLFS